MASRAQTRQIGTKTQECRTRVRRRCRPRYVPATYGAAECWRRRHCSGHGYVRYNKAMPKRPTSDDVRRRGRRRGDRVPVRAVRRHAREAEREAGAGAATRGPARRRRRVRRLRRRRHRPDARQPGPDRDARRRQLHPAAVEAGDRLVRLRRDRRGRGVALLPADDPAAPDRARRRRRLRAQDRLRARVLPRPQDRGRRDRDRGPARHPRAAVLRHPRPHPVVRLRRRRRPQRQLAGLGDVRDRPRGRQRAVRAELGLRRRAHELRPRGLLPLHGRGDGPGARPDRDLHAEALRPPDGQRLPLSHEPLGRGDEPVRARRRTTTRAASA